MKHSTVLTQQENARVLGLAENESFLTGNVGGGATWYFGLVLNFLR